MTVLELLLNLAETLGLKLQYATDNDGNKVGYTLKGLTTSPDNIDEMNAIAEVKGFYVKFNAKGTMWKYGDKMGMRTINSLVCLPSNIAYVETNDTALV